MRDTLQLFITYRREGILKTWWYSEQALRHSETIISPLSHVRHLPLVCVSARVALFFVWQKLQSGTVLFNTNCNFNWLSNGESKTSLWTHLKSNVLTFAFVPSSVLQFSYLKASPPLSLSHTHTHIYIFIWSNLFTYLPSIFFLSLSTSFVCVCVCVCVLEILYWFLCCEFVNLKFFMNAPSCTRWGKIMNQNITHEKYVSLLTKCSM
jgi:hypothetical protein